MIRLTDFDYSLPSELIASEPLAQRDGSRMMIVDRQAGTFSDHYFASFPEHLQPDDLLVLNDTRVFPARLFGKTETGASVEVLLVREIEHLRWEVLARPAKRLRPGRRIVFGPGFSAVVEEKPRTSRIIIRFETAGELFELLDEYGRTPLPPYIDRCSSTADTDRDRYQTIYARKRGAIAAPTAGLHFTERLLNRIRGRGVGIAQLTLHVGYGTFEPVRVEDIRDHKVLPEAYEIGPDAAAMLNVSVASQRRIVSVGTTTLRALEHACSGREEFSAGSGLADLTILPGHRFRAVGALLTNFHLPKSSLLILVSAFAGRELIIEAYEHAVRERYRFYSYGDCMFII